MARLGQRFGITRYEADEYYRLALQAYEKKNLEEAILKVDDAIRLYSRRAEYYATRGFFRLEDGIDNKASEDFDQALVINPYELLANYGKGVIAYNSEEYEQAFDYLAKAWAADNNRVEVLYYLALVYHRLRNNYEAKRWMQQAVEVYEKVAETDRDARKAMKNAERWIKEFDKLIKEHQKHLEKEAKANQKKKS